MTTNKPIKNSKKKVKLQPNRYKVSETEFYKYSRYGKQVYHFSLLDIILFLLITGIIYIIITL